VVGVWLGSAGEFALITVTGLVIVLSLTLCSRLAALSGALSVVVALWIEFNPGPIAYAGASALILLTVLAEPLARRTEWI
jgi:hypothetical protein